jgi:hypothetical protein
MTSACEHCGALLEQPKTGRPRKFCSEACKAKAKRRRGRLGSFAEQFRGAPKRPAPKPREKPPERAEALQRALAAVKLAEERLRQALAARAALDAGLRNCANDDPLDPPHEHRAFSGDEWLASKGGSFGAPLDTEAVAENYRQQAEGEQG